MNDQEINIAIAEARGWTDIEVAPYDMKHVAKGDLHGKFLGHLTEIPNSTTDLNAMHDAEKTLTNDQCATYLATIAESLPATGVNSWAFKATARQRAEAFLRTIGKWKEGE